jgi:hypothetical protein
MAEGLMEEIVRCRHWIEDALEYSGGTHTFKDIVDGILNMSFQFWPAPRGCAVTEICVFPQKKVLHIFLAAGEKDQIVDMDESAVRFAKEQGCDAVTIAGRRGWKKVLAHKGYEEYFTTLAKDI